MKIPVSDPLYAKLHSDREFGSSEKYQKLITWKLACLRFLNTQTKDKLFIILNDSKYLLFSSVFTTNPKVYGIWNIEENYGEIFEEPRNISLIGSEFRTFNSQSISDTNELIFNELNGSVSFEDRAFDMLKTLSSMKENQSKSPDELVIKAIQITLSFNQSMRNLKN